MGLQRPKHGNEDSKKRNPIKLGYWAHFCEHINKPSGFIKAKILLANGVITHCQGGFCVTVEVLPLVEFQLEPGISDEEAVRLIEAPAPLPEEPNDGRGWLQSAGDTYQTMQFDESPGSITDLFTARLMNFEVHYLKCDN